MDEPIKTRRTLCASGLIIFTVSPDKSMAYDYLPEKASFLISVLLSEAALQALALSYLKRDVALYDDLILAQKL